jgi:molybdopterin/thiamine biosynthesis adenylyltransferase
VERYTRQQGLVVQDVLADAEIAVTGTGPAVTYLLQCLAMLGTATRHGRLHLRVADRKATHDDLAGQFLLRPEDLDEPLGAALVRRVGDIDPAVNISVDHAVPPDVLTVAVPAAGEPSGSAEIWGRVGATTVEIGPGPAPAAGEPAPANALTPALACVCGGLLAQAVLNRLGALITGPAVLSGWIEERLWLRHPGLGRDARDTRLEAPVLSGVLAAPDFRILHDGEPVEARITTVVDDDNVVVSLPRRPAPTGTATTVRPIRRAGSPVRPLTWTPFAAAAVAVPDRMPASRVVMCGAGALGGWAGATLAVTPADGLDLCVVDMDGEVERHNLNRQVLYTGADIGRPKAHRAVERLAEINPAAGLRGIQAVIDVHSRDQLLGDEVMLGDDPAVAAQRARIDELGTALRAADAVLSCPDNQRTRWVLNCLTERLGIPLVNGAVDGFVGRVHVCDPEDSGRCLVCWLGRAVARNPERRSCTDTTGPAPVDRDQRGDRRRSAGGDADRRAHRQRRDRRPLPRVRRRRG